MIGTAVDKMVFGLENTPESSSWSSGSAMRTTALRFDMEFSSASVAKDFNLYFDTVGDTIKAELTDLILNGDRDSSDVLLRSLDGLRKRQEDMEIELTTFEINSARYDVETNEKRKTEQYTTHLTIFLAWNGIPDFTGTHFPESVPLVADSLEEYTPLV